MFSITKEKTNMHETQNKNDIFLLNREGRFTALEGLRGIAVLMVYFVHFFSYYDNPRFLSQENPYISYVVRYLHQGQIGVDLFFVLSGFFISASLAKRGTGFGDFIIKRFRRLLPAHAAVLLVLVLTNKIFNLYVIITNLLFINIFLPGSKVINIVAWSLGYEVVFYTLYGLWNTILRKIKVLHTWYAFALVFAAIWTAQWWGQPFVSMLSGNTLKIPDMSRFIGFLFGVGLAKLYLSQRLNGRASGFVKAFTIPAILFLVLLQWSFEWGRAHKAVYFLLVDGAFSIVIASVLVRTKYMCFLLNSRFLRFTGIISYSFYLVHPLIVSGMLTGLMLASKYAGFGIPLILATAATYLVSAIMFLLLEKWYFAGGNTKKIRRTALK